MGCLYILGALFYALRVPERFFPGKFDIWVSNIKMFIYDDSLLDRFDEIDTLYFNMLIL